MLWLLLVVPRWRVKHEKVSWAYVQQCRRGYEVLTTSELIEALLPVLLPLGRREVSGS